MEEEKVKHSIFYYLNPYIWIRGIVSYILTFILILNHFFVFILGGIIIILTIWFFYDRYALATYDGSTASDYSDAIFSKAEKYDSPLARGDRYLTQELNDYLAAERKQVVRTKPEAKEKISENQETINTIEIEDAPDWDRRDDVSRSFISREVQRRVSEIEYDVLKKQK